MTVDYNEELHEVLERNITIEPNLGTITRIGNGEYKYYAPSSTPGDTALVVRIYYEQFQWYCAYGRMGEDSSRTNNVTEDLICGCPIWTWTQVNRRYGMDSIMIAWDSLDVKVQPDTIYAGGVVQVVVKKRLPDGTLTDFPPEQTYEIAKLEGCLSGNIVVGQDSGAYFYDVSQPIYFTVADSLVGDSVGTVLLQVGLVDNSLRPSLENDPNNIESNECFTGIFQSESKDNINLIINEVVRIDWNANTYFIEPVPEMPDNLSICVIPNFFNNGPYFLDWDLEIKWVSTEQDPDKTFSYTFNGQTIGYSADGVELELPQTDETIIGGDEITLTVRYTDNYFTDEEVTKKLTGMKILGENPDKQVIKDYIANHEFPIIDMSLSETVTEDDQILQMQILVMKESTWFHFKDERDEYHNYPAAEWGYNNMNPNPHDWGLSQLSTAEPSLGVIWNWKVNINAGILHLWNEKYPIAKSLFRNIKKDFELDGKVIRDPNRLEFLIMLAQLYRGGAYYDSFKFIKGTNGEFCRIKNKKGIKYDYGEDFWNKFEDVDNGSPYPNEW